MFKVILSTSSTKFILKQSPDAQKRIAEAIEIIKYNPLFYRKSIKPLKGRYRGYYRFRLGPIRIVYRLERQEATIHIGAIDYRGGIY